MATYNERFEQIRMRFSERDKKMSMVAEARNGNLGSVYPSLFPEGQWSQPIVANMIDIVAKTCPSRSVFSPLSPLPVTQPSMRVLEQKPTSARR